MELIKENRNELMKRREVEFSMQHNSNPGFEQVRTHIADNFKTKVENVAVKSLKNNFGANKFMIQAFIYDSLEHKERTEPKVKTKKSSGENG